MPVKCDEYGQVSVIALRGDFVGPEIEQLREIVDRRIGDRRVLNLVIDCEGSRFIGSEGLETLLAVQKRCEERRGQIRLAGLDDNCRKILQITRLDHRFECHADLATALKSAG